MVLELLVNPKKIQGKSWELIFLGIVYALVSVFLALWIFRDYASIVMIALTIVVSIPLVRSIISVEEKKDLQIKQEFRLFEEHGKAILCLLYLFVGYTIAFLFFYLVMPSALLEKIFSAQIETILSVTAAPTGNFIGSMQLLSKIFLNNVKILFLCIVFSFFYGAGAIFILTWNASVMAAAIGSFIRDSFLGGGFFSYLHLTVVGLARYMLHGIPEIVAYFIGALASGMISFAIVNHDFMNDNFKKIIKDSVKLTGIAIVLLFISGLIEVYITGLLF